MDSRRPEGPRPLRSSPLSLHLGSRCPNEGMEGWSGGPGGQKLGFRALPGGFRGQGSGSADPGPGRTALPPGPDRLRAGAVSPRHAAVPKSLFSAPVLSAALPGGGRPERRRRLRGRPPPVERPGPFPTLPLQLLPQRSAGEDLRDPIRPEIRAIGGRVESGVAGHLAQHGQIARHQRRSRLERLDGGKAEPLVEGGERHAARPRRRARRARPAPRTRDGPPTLPRGLGDLLRGPPRPSTPSRRRAPAAAARSRGPAAAARRRAGSGRSCAAPPSPRGARSARGSPAAGRRTRSRPGRPAPWWIARTRPGETPISISSRAHRLAGGEQEVRLEERPLQPLPQGLGRVRPHRPRHLEQPEVVDGRHPRARGRSGRGGGKR